MGEARILSRSSVPFADRRDAARQLAQELAAYRGRRPLVLGIPRGGVILAQEVAHALDADMDVLLAHKLSSPGHPELAMGSVAESGGLFLNEEVIRSLDVDERRIQQERDRRMAEIRRRSELFRAYLPRMPLKDRTVIVTDDGVATGATTQAAIRAARLERPDRLVGALPVGPEDTMIELARETDELICLRSPPSFAAVGQFYQHFEPVTDDDVLEALREEGLRRHRG